MNRPTRATPAGRAYLDLQNRARAERRGTQELLTLYVVERWLARLSTSPYTEQFVLKGGMLLAAFDARRPTADADVLARGIANEEALYAGVRIAMDADIATAVVRFRLDVNFGDPITPDRDGTRRENRYRNRARASEHSGARLRRHLPAHQ